MGNGNVHKTSPFASHVLNIDLHNHNLDAAFVRGAGRLFTFLPAAIILTCCKLPFVSGVFHLECIMHKICFFAFSLGKRIIIKHLHYTLQTRALHFALILLLEPLECRGWFDRKCCNLAVITCSEKGAGGKKPEYRANPANRCHVQRERERKKKTMPF